MTRIHLKDGLCGGGDATRAGEQPFKLAVGAVLKAKCPVIVSNAPSHRRFFGEGPRALWGAAGAVCGWVPAPTCPIK
jgi:hypothetical protein